jgi:hypothetical protein
MQHTQITPARWYSESIRSAGIAVAVAIVGSALIGGLTSVGQGVLPDWAKPLSNSAGGWTMFTFLLVWLGRARPLLAGILGIVSFELLNEAYGVVSLWRGHFYSEPFGTIWTAIGFVAGPLVGVAAALTRHGSPLWRVLGVTPLAAVLLGEGIRSLGTVADTTGSTYWIIEIVLSVVFMAAALIRVPLRLNGRALAVIVWLVGAMAFMGFEVVVLGG